MDNNHDHDHDQELDIVIFENEDGTEEEYEILFAFEHNDENFAVLQRYIEDEAEIELNDEELEDVYILRILGEGEDETLEPVEEDLLPELTEVVGALLEQEFGDLSDQDVE